MRELHFQRQKHVKWLHVSWCLLTNDAILELSVHGRCHVTSINLNNNPLKIAGFHNQSPRLTMLSVGRDLKYFLYQPILCTVSAKLYVWTKGPVLQSRLRNHRWSLLISKVALLSVSMFCNEGGGRGGREFARQVYFKQYFPRHEVKRNNLKSHFNLLCSKICTSRIYLGLFYASRKDPLPPSCFTMLIFSRIELKLAHK